MTVHNWVMKGRRGVLLKTASADVKNPAGGPHARKVTYSNWVDAFLREATTIV
jgi:hypothetical protein